MVPSSASQCFSRKNRISKMAGSKWRSQISVLVYLNSCARSVAVSPHPSNHGSENGFNGTGVMRTTLEHSQYLYQNLMAQSNQALNASCSLTRYVSRVSMRRWCLLPCAFCLLPRSPVSDSAQAFPHCVASAPYRPDS